MLEAAVQEQVVLLGPSELSPQSLAEDPASVALLYLDDWVDGLVLLPEHSEGQPEVLHVLFLSGVVVGAAAFEEKVGNVGVCCVAGAVRHELPCFFLLCDEVAIEGDGVGVVGCEVAGEERVLVAPEGDPNYVESECGLLSTAGEYVGEVFDGEVVVVDEDDFEGAQVSEVWKRGEVVVGEVEFDEVEALRERGDVDGEGRVQDEQFERLVFWDQLFQRHRALPFPTYYIH